MLTELGPIFSFLLENGIVPLGFFVAWWQTQRTMGEAMNKRFETVLANEQAKWEAALAAERTERDRQYGVFRDLMEQNSINTGNLASLKADISNLDDKVDRLEGAVREGMSSVHGRLDHLVRKGP